MTGRRLPPKYLNFSIVLAVFLHYVMPIRRIIYPPFAYLGIILILLGVVLNVWSVAVLRRNNTTIEFHGKPVTLVTDGPYQISRNPIYQSGVVLSFGVAVLLGSLITFAFPIGLFVILNALYVPSEEAALEQAFGEEYLRYKQKVRRWI